MNLGSEPLLTPALAAQFSRELEAQEGDALNLHLERRVLDVCLGACVADWPRFALRTDFNPTASVDDAILLIQHVLPTYGYGLSTSLAGARPAARLYAPPPDPDAPVTDGRSWAVQHAGSHPTDPAKALVSALLHALSALPDKES